MMLIGHSALYLETVIGKMEIPQLLALLKLKKISLFIKNGGTYYDMNYIVGLISERVPSGEILQIGVFGSSLHTPKYTTVTKKYLWVLSHTEQVHINKPNDLDIFVVTKAFSSYARLPIVYNTLVDDGYCLGWREQFIENGLHLLIVDQDELNTSTKNVATGIREGVLLAGTAALRQSFIKDFCFEV